MQSEKRLVLTMGVLLLTIGITEKFNLDVILGTMVLGFILVNKSPRRIAEVLTVFKTLASPVYVIFGILVGARLDFLKMPLWLWGIVIVYVLFRSLGKYYGAYFGARISNADEGVKKYLGSCLLTQGGIAAGLAIIAGQHVNHIVIEGNLYLGDVIVFVVTASTLIVQFLGQALLKRALFKTGENDKNVTEEDVIKGWKVKDVLQQAKAINEALPLTAVMNRFQNENFLSLPVVNKKNEIVGLISLEDMKELLTDQDSWMWILTTDVMEPVSDMFYLETPLDEAMEILKTVNQEQAPILNSIEDSTLAGIITLPYINICISRELLKRQGEVDRV
jgi:CBS domain-containing protein